jgi:hypothetical protein
MTPKRKWTNTWWWRVIFSSRSGDYGYVKNNDVLALPDCEVEWQGQTIAGRPTFVRFFPQELYPLPPTHTIIVDIWAPPK